MKRTRDQMRDDALRIWRAGVEAVGSEHLVRRNVKVDGQRLGIGEVAFDLGAIGRIVVVGAGKAGAGMAAGLEQALGPTVLAEKQLTGWVHVPDNCVRPLAAIHLHPARPAGVNEPTPQGVEGSREILRLLGSLAPNDLCIALISGGGSALLPLPIAGISLDDKLAVTKFLSAAGAPIEDLNTVRKQLSQVKGGNLARACRAGQLVSLIISDVLGDPLDTIASGPTVEDHSTREQALAVLERYGARQAGLSPKLFEVLGQASRQPRETIGCRVTNLVIGNNALAVEAAGLESERLGYTPVKTSAKTSEGYAEEVGRGLAELAQKMRFGPGPDCSISGGEPVVKLAEVARRGLGGRNQQLVLAAVERLQSGGAEGILILSGGTDGEDGPTDAAGAFADSAMIADAAQCQLDASDYLARNDAYHWFEPLGALVKTGPTDTNVCDLRVVLVDRVESSKGEGGRSAMR